MTFSESSASTSTGSAHAVTDAGAAVMDQATRTAEAQASRTMMSVADSLSGVASSVRDASRSMREQQPQLADFAETAPEQADRAATYLREHDAADVLAATQEFGRRQPAVVIAGGLVLGLVAGRLLRTSAGPNRNGNGYSSTRSGMDESRYLSGRSNQASTWYGQGSEWTDSTARTARAGVSDLDAPAYADEPSQYGTSEEASGRA